VGGTTTILCSDIPGSTDALYRLGDDDGSAALGAHLDLLRSVATTHRGTVTKQLGDGVMACFDAAVDGVHAAIAMQQAVERAGREDDAITSSVRIGLHVGDVVDGTADVAFGSAVVVARRLCDAARPGQILASQVVRLLVGNRPSLEHLDIGVLDLKGVPEPVEVVSYSWEPADDPPVRVVVAEDAAIIRDGIIRLLTAEGFDVVADAADFDALVAAVDRHRPGLVITDIRMPPTQSDEGLRAARYTKDHHPDTAVLVLSQHVAASAAGDLLDGSVAGVGYLLKERVSNVDEFVDAARRVAAGGNVIDPLITEELLRTRGGGGLAGLSEREREVLDLMAQGLSNQAIGERLFVSAKTVESHVRSIFVKLDLPEEPTGNRRVQAVVRWLDQPG
jgi:DNA-binding NarL/FixJ family response regulator/class 3 adenylate cyclase